MIEKIHVNSLRNSEFSQFVRNVLSIVDHHGPEALNVAENAAALETAMDSADALFKARRGFEGTEELVRLDARRDRAITGLNLHLAAQAYHYDEAIVTNANLLAGHLKHYGGSAIARENYASETAIIRNMVQEIDVKPALSGAVTALQLSQWVAELEAANEAFDEQYLARNTEMSTASNDNLRNRRLEAAEAYSRLVELIGAYYVVQRGAEPFAAAVAELNTLIGQYNVLLGVRRSRTDFDDETPNGNGAIPEPAAAPQPQS